MNLVETLTDPEFLLAALAAISAAAVVFTFGSSFFDRSDMKDRVRRVALERERLRNEELARLRGANQSQSSSIRQQNESKAIVNSVVERFSLKKAFVDEKTYLSLLYALMIGILGSYLPLILLKNAITKRQGAIRRAWPDCLDLMLLCVEAGMSVEHAFKRVGAEMAKQSAELAEELALTTAELSFLSERTKAYENMGIRTGVDGVRSVMTALMQAERYGTSVGQSLRVMAEEGREMRMMEAEKKAASLPPKLTVPLILFFLPVLINGIGARF
jgi:tight adherence protein C